MLLTGTAVFAQNLTVAAGGTELPRLREIRQLVSQVAANQKEILLLKADALRKYSEAKAKIKKIMDSPEDLSAEQLAQLKNTLDLLKQDKKAIMENKIQTDAAFVALRKAKKERAYEKARLALTSIIKNQEEGRDALKKAIIDLDAIL